MMMQQPRWFRSLALLVCVAWGVNSYGEAELALGEVTSGSVAGEIAEAVYVFDAPEAGLFTAVVIADRDVFLDVTDGDDFEFVGGFSDQDLDGLTGREHVVIVVDTPGPVRVRIGAYEGETEFALTAGFTPVPALRTDDDDARPGGAGVADLEPGRVHRDALDPGNGDERDFVRIKARPGTTLAVMTDADAGDLWLELYDPDEPGYPFWQSDADLGGDPAREAAVTVVGWRGELLALVRSVDGEPVSYRLSAVEMPTPAALFEPGDDAEEAQGDEEITPAPRKAPRAPI